MNNRKLFSFVLLFMALAATIVIMKAPSAYAYTVNNDTTNKIVTMTGTSYTMKFNYNAQARVTSFIVNSRETLDPAQGIFSAVLKGSWITTQSLAVSPAVSVSGNVVTATLSTTAANETWVFTVSDANVQFRLDRTYTSAGTIAQQGTPMINFSEFAFDQMRWLGDGGNFPLGGSLLNTYQSWWLATGANLSTNNSVAKEQMNYTMLDATYSNALRIAGTSNRSAVSRGEATEIHRSTNNDVRLSIYTSAAGLQYASGSSLGYSTDNCDGHMRCDGNPVFSGVSVANGQLDQVTLTFTPDTYANYYDLGTLVGVDETKLSKAINDYGRWMMQDTKRGASAEASIQKAEVPPLEMHWLGQLISIFNSPEAISSFKYGLQDIRDYLVEPGTGRLRCCRPLTGVYWGVHYRDQASGYALGVTTAYNLSGDSAWLTGMKTSVEGGLDYLINNYTNPTTRLLTNNSNGSASNYDNNYWESSAGTYDGYSSAMLYDALIQWANLERNVLSNPTKATTYEGIAATLKASFNANMASGGLWSPTTNSFLYGSGNQDVRYLPVQGAVMKSDIATLDRRRLIAQGVENDAVSGGFNFHFMNYKDLYIAGAAAPACGKIAENGGWYGAADGDFYGAFPILNDRNKIPSYMGYFLTRYAVDGFYGNSAYSRANMNTGCGAERWFPTTVMPAWGLYTYAYGFQPQYDKLVIAPFINTGMVGSIVKYTWRSQPLTVTYNSVSSYTISAAALPTNIQVRWINQTPGASYQVQVDGGAATPVTADSNGYVNSTLSSTGTHTFNCLNCTSKVDDYNTGITYSGSWLTTTDVGYYVGTGHYANTPGNFIQYSFTGTAIQYIGGKNADHGKVDIYIDGVLNSTIDTYASTWLKQQVLYSITGLASGNHTIKIVIRSDKNAAATGTFTDADSFISS